MKFALVDVYESTSIDSDIGYTWHATIKSRMDDSVVDEFKGLSNPSLTNTLMAAIGIATYHGCSTVHITYHSKSGPVKKLDYTFSFGGITVKDADCMAKKLINE